MLYFDKVNFLENYSLYKYAILEIKKENKTF